MSANVNELLPIGTKVRVAYSDGSSWPATVVGYDEQGNYRVLDETGAAPIEWTVLPRSIHAAASEALPEKTYTITLTEEKYRSLLEFLARGVDDLAHYVKEYGDEYAAEDRIDEVVQSGYDLINELPDL